MIDGYERVDCENCDVANGHILLLCPRHGHASKVALLKEAEQLLNGWASPDAGRFTKSGEPRADWQNSDGDCVEHEGADCIHVRTAALVLKLREVLP